MSAPEPVAAATPKPTAVARSLLRLGAAASAVMLTLAVIGYVVRDRTVWLAVLMYLPMVLVAPLAIVAQAVAFERARWKRRAAVMVVAAVGLFASVRSMRGDGFTGRPADALYVVQWNVQWGRDAAGWRETVRQIRQAVPDIVILSEAPDDEKISDLCRALGDEWTFQVLRHPRGSRYWYALAVASRWPVMSAGRELPNGIGLMVMTGPPQDPWRLLVVDGVSDPLVSRTPMLAEVAASARGTAETGFPYDVIAGDFNAVSRSVGFDELEQLGFTLASRSARGWRGTYPAALPLYDIDHVWLGREHQAAGCVMLDSPGTNHRGQLVFIKPRTPR